MWLKKIYFGLKKIYKRIKLLFISSPFLSDISRSQTSIEIINDKIKLLKGINKDTINLFSYKKYFDFLEELGLREDFNIFATQDKISLSATIFRPILANENNHKIIIFCHGLNNDRWSLFYIMHLSLQLGYQVVAYDARNHGDSSKSYNTLGQIEASDLQDVVNHVKKKFCPEKVGLYGFSMGAATLLFWISHFSGNDNCEVSLAICESPFDEFSKQLKVTLGKGISYYWRKFIIDKMVERTLNSSYEKLEKISPVLSLPQSLSIKLLLLHGLKDEVISWKASFNLWRQLRKSELNKKKVNLYLCKYADHGEFPFVSDNVLKSLRWKNPHRKSQFNFTSLFVNYLEKNL